jgi:putative oxidoreductase
MLGVMTHQWKARLNSYSPAVLSVFRVVFGLLFLSHGVAVVFGWPAAAGLTAEAGAWPFWWGGVLELVTGILISIGLWTRICAFVASGAMALAYFTEHLSAGFLPIANDGETAVVYCFAFFLLVFTGGGDHALDARRRRGATAQ